MKPEKSEFPEELTEAMHDTFTIAAEHDVEYRVWSCIRAQAQTGWPLAEVLAGSGVTMADYEKYKDTQPNG